MSISTLKVNDQQMGLEHQEWRVSVSKVAGDAGTTTIFNNFGSAMTAVFSSLQSGLYVQMEGVLLPSVRSSLIQQRG